MVVICGLMLGLMKSATLQKRVSTLLDIKKLLRRFKTEISYTGKELGELVRSCGDIDICSKAAQIEGVNPLEALEKAADSALICRKEKELFSDFVRGLGRTGVQGQIGHIELYQGLFDSLLAQARDENAKKSKLYTALGLFSGITVCVLLM